MNGTALDTSTLVSSSSGVVNASASANARPRITLALEPVYG